MNSIVERLRWPTPALAEHAKIAADLIEQQAERIKELEAWRDSWVKCPEGAVAQRIMELEAERDMLQDQVNTERDAKYSLQDKLAALRQRIADAPVVAWMGEYNINDIRDHYTVVMRHKTDFSSMPDRVRPLYTHPQPAIPDGMVLAKAENLIACRDALVDKDRDEAYHQLYTSVDWGDPFKPWAEWEAMLAAAPKPENSHD